MNTQNQNTRSRKPPLPPSAAAVVAAGAAALGARRACAFCKKQQQLCTVRCPVAPFFPADKQEDFENVDRLFGIRRVVKVLKGVEPQSRQEAVKSIVYEANFRAKHPVGGCCAAIKELSRRINAGEAELKRVREILASRRERVLQQDSKEEEESRNRTSDSRKREREAAVSPEN